LIKLVTILQIVHYISDSPAWVEVILSRLAAVEFQQPQIMNQMELKLNRILQKIEDGGAGLGVEKMPDGISLPLGTFDDIDNFEIEMVNTDTFKQMVRL